MMSLGIVTKVACQRIFVLSDPGVPKSYVVDCLWLAYESQPVEILLFKEFAPNFASVTFLKYESRTR